MKRPLAHVTDHAVLRFLERVGGWDIDAVRREIAAEVETGIEAGACAVNTGTVTYVLEGRSVITVLPRSRNGRRNTR